MSDQKVLHTNANFIAMLFPIGIAMARTHE